MRTFIFAFTSLLLSTFSFSQDLGIQHYQRKSEAFAFVFPYSEFSAKGLLLNFPDSLYNFGDVTIKKAHFASFKVNDYLLHFEKDTVASVQFYLSGKKNFESYTAFLVAQSTNVESAQLDKLIGESIALELIHGTTVYYSFHKKRRKVRIAFTYVPNLL